MGKKTRGNFISDLFRGKILAMAKYQKFMAAVASSRVFSYNVRHGIGKTEATKQKGSGQAILASIRGSSTVLLIRAFQ